MTFHTNDLPSLSIRRPVLVLVINLLIILAGIAAIMAIEVRELPDVDRPIVSIIANYPGASPETVDTEVTSVLEGAVARVSGLRDISSSSSENNGRIRLEFLPGMDLDVIASDVREALSRVQRRLPDAVEDVIVIKADSNSQPIMNLAIYSETLMGEDIARIVNQDIIPELISIDGVADITLNGIRRRILRVVVDPLRLTSLGLSVSDVADVLQRAPFDVPAGSFRSAGLGQELVVRADASVYTAEQVANIIIRDNTRVGDVSTVYFGPQDTFRYTRLNGKNVIGLGVIRKAQSNTIEISNNIRAAIEGINERYDNLELTITEDDAEFIRSSVHEVEFTLSIVILIVITTIWMFMGSIRATLIPSVTIPISLIGTMAGIWLLGFSINILTLLALVLATGLVVDDAIVVLENIQRRRKQEGLGGRAAAVLGTRQVFFAVVTTTAVLISVFVPIAFLPGTAGRLFREFGFVMALSVGISCFVSMSLVPAMASRLPDNEKNTIISRLFAWIGTQFRELYARTLSITLDHPAIAVIVALTLGIGAFSVFQSLTRQLLPEEDRGMVRIGVSGPEGVGINYMDQYSRRIEAMLQPLIERGEVKSLFTGVFQNRANITAPLVDWGDRERSQQEIMRSLDQPMSELIGVQASVWGGGSSLGIGGGQGNRINVALIGNEYLRIYDVAQSFARVIEESSTNLSNPEISYRPTQPQLVLEIDRRRAADLGISLTSLAETLRVMVDGDEVVDLNINDEAVPILLEASTGEINDPTDLVNLYVGTQSGNLLPLSSVVTIREEGVPSDLDRRAQRRAIGVDMDITPGYPLQSAVDDLRSIAEEVLPADISMILLGQAATLEETSRDVMIIYIIAFLVVFLVLCAQFEGFTSAVVVMLLVPFGIAAAIFALYITGTSLNIYSQIGLVILIGLMAKNGVLVVEFADQLRDQGYDIRKAIEAGALIRLKPVSMTMICTILSGLPLILSAGAGAEARSSIGWVIFGGMGIASLFTLYLTPVLYIILARFSSARAMESTRLSEELKLADAARESHGHRF